jgi:hypothetical protein
MDDQQPGSPRQSHAYDATVGKLATAAIAYYFTSHLFSEKILKFSSKGAAQDLILFLSIEVLSYFPVQSVTRGSRSIKIVHDSLTCFSEFEFRLGYSMSIFQSARNPGM